MLNGSWSNDLAASFAKRLMAECGNERDLQIDRAFRLATGRAPTDAERRLSQQFLQNQPLEEFALAIFNLNAFLYVE
jgi:hypothetical protein